MKPKHQRPVFVLQWPIGFTFQILCIKSIFFSLAFWLPSGARDLSFGLGLYLHLFVCTSSKWLWQDCTDAQAHIHFSYSLMLYGQKSCDLNLIELYNELPEKIFKSF